MAIIIFLDCSETEWRCDNLEVVFELQKVDFLLEILIFRPKSLIFTHFLCTWSATSIQITNRTHLETYDTKPEPPLN